MNPLRSASLASKLSRVEAKTKRHDGMDYSTWMTIAKVALWFIAGTGMIAAFAILVGGKSNKDDRD
jgi:hypothetical protein